MIEIKLQDGYFIEVDPLNYTLRQRYSGKTKDGEEKESVRTHGYYGSIRQAVIHNSFADGFYGRYEHRLERICGFD